MAHSDSKRDAIEVAARPLRELQKAEHDEIAAAQRALREAEHAHNRAMEKAERDARAASSVTPIAAHGHELILFDDRLSTHGANHPLTPEVAARVEADPDGVTVTVEGSGWSESVTFPRRHERRARTLAREVEAAARNVEEVTARRRALVQEAAAERDSAATDRGSVQETRALIHRLGELCHGDEDVLDMAPAISAGHDGVLVATDRRLLFISLRRTLAIPYADVLAVSAKGRWLGARLIVSTANGNVVFGGVDRRHAAELAELVGARLETRAPVRAS